MAKGFANRKVDRPTYINFLEQLLKTSRDTKGDQKALDRLLTQNLDKLDEKLAEVLPSWARGKLSRLRQTEARNIAGDIVNFSNLIQNFPLGNRGVNVEIAIAGYKVVASVFPRETSPVKWATLQNNLGAAYWNRIRGERAENIEQAIDCYQQALQERTRQRFPEDWAMTQKNLGAAYGNRIRGERAENIDLAIYCFQQALQEYTRQRFPEYWARTQNNLGNAYRDRIRGERAENIEQAIDCYQQALQEYTRQGFPEQWATTQNNLGIAYCYRIRGERAENIELAIDCFQQALQERTRQRFPQDWAMTQNNLGIAYGNRIRGERAENIELAIDCFQQALLEYTRQRFPQDWAMTQNNLGAAYSDRIRGERAENIELAIDCYQQALQERTCQRFPENHAETSFNLGRACQDGRQFENAYTAFKSSIDTVESLRGEIITGSGREEDKQKLAEEWNQLYRGMVEVCLELHKYTEAIEYVERSKARNLVELFANRNLEPKGDIPAEVLQELRRLQREIRVQQQLLDNAETLLAGSTQKSIAPPQEDGQRTGTAATGTRADVEQLRREVSDLQQQLQGALDEIRKVDPSYQLTQRVEPISFQEIRALLERQTAIIAWYITDERFFTFIITENTEQPYVWQSSRDDLEKLKTWRDEYLEGYDAFRRRENSQWKDDLPTRLRRLSEILHLDEILSHVPDSCHRLILIPHLYLHLLPLTVLPVASETRFLEETGFLEPWNCLLDRFPGGAGCAPSCQLLQLSAIRQETTALQSSAANLFAIQNPTGDLDFAELEVEAICRDFNQAQILSGQGASKDALTREISAGSLRDKKYVHFSCHGIFNFAAPEFSTLLLADSRVAAAPDNDRTRYLPLREGDAAELDKCLTVVEVFNLELPTCRLVTLSACETGLSDWRKLTDEYISFPSGFLYAGSPSVVCSLWAVNDLSTGFLMVKFYQNLQSGQSVAVALNSAQNWLRDITKEELQEWTAKLPLVGNKKLSLRRWFNTIEANTKPFESPYHWAAFCAIGQ